MGSFYMEATQINYRRDETIKTVDQKLQELSENSAIDTDIAPVFKSIKTYAPGDMVYYRNKLYVFNVEHTGAWAAADVTATDVTTTMNAGFSTLMSGLTNVDIISDTAGFRVLRSVNTVTVFIDMTVTNDGSSDAWVNLGTYSGNHAPRYNVYSQVFDNNSPGVILSNRSIKIYNSSGTTKVQVFLATGESIAARGSVTYVV